MGRALATFLAEHRPDGGRVLGVGAAICGRVDPAHDIVVRHEALGWDHYPLGAGLRRHTGLPVRVDNHAHAVARSELLFGRSVARRSLVHAPVRRQRGGRGARHRGRGAQRAQVEGRRRGASAGAGQHGTVSVRPYRLSGGDGSDTVLAWRAVAAGLIPEANAGLLVDAAAAGDRRADALRRERARAVGRATGLLLDVLTPDLVVISERSSTLRSAYLDEIRTAAIAHAHVCDDPERIVVPHAGPASLLVAAATVVLNPLLTSPLQACRNTAAMLP